MARVSRVGEDAGVDLEPRIGAAPAAYVAEIVTRTRDVLGRDLLAVCLMGSAALGDYRPGRSDIDVAVVARRPLPVVARDALLGPPPAALFPELPDALVRAAARDSLDWWSAHGGHPSTAVLAACVAWRWAETGTWSA